MILALLGLLGTAAGVTLWEETHSRDPAPSFTLTSTGYENGTQGEPVQFSLDDYRGKTVVLDFMAVACTTCRVVTDDILKPLYAEHKDRDDFVILSIDTWANAGPENTFGGETTESLIRLQEQEEVPWRHALDTDEVYVKYAAVSLPKVVVVDGEGRIAYSRTGSQDRGDMESAVEASLAGAATPISFLSVGILGLAFIAGLASIFTPCSIGLLPAYLGLLLQDAAGAPVPTRIRRVIHGGIATSAGIVTLYLLLAIVFWAAGDVVRPALPYVGMVVGVVMVAVGVLALAGGWARISTGLRLGQGPDARRGFFAFGASYGLAGFACTGPLFLPILLAGFSIGPSTGVAAFLLYAAAVAITVLVAATFVAAGEESRFRRLLDSTRYVQRVVSVLLVGAGIYLVWYGAKANGFV